MKRNIVLAAILLLMGVCSFAQTAALERNREFAGADADLPEYKAIYQLDTNNPQIVKKAIRNINNVLNDPRLKGKVQIELVTFSGGTETFLKDKSEYGDAIKGLIEKGVIVAQCENSLAERGLTKDQLFDFIGYVPSGNGELIIRAKQGWVIVKP